MYLHWHYSTYIGTTYSGSYLPCQLLKLADNLRLRVRDVHIVLDDCSLVPGSPFAVGLSIDAISLLPTAPGDAPPTPAPVGSPARPRPASPVAAAAAAAAAPAAAALPPSVLSTASVAAGDADADAPPATPGSRPASPPAAESDLLQKTVRTALYSLPLLTVALLMMAVLTSLQKKTATLTLLQKPVRGSTASRGSLLTMTPRATAMTIYACYQVRIEGLVVRTCRRDLSEMLRDDFVATADLKASLSCSRSHSRSRTRTLSATLTPSVTRILSHTLTLSLC